MLANFLSSKRKQAPVICLMSFPGPQNPATAKLKGLEAAPCCKFAFQPHALLQDRTSHLNSKSIAKLEIARVCCVLSLCQVRLTARV